MRYLSVCSGIEGATVAWAQLGWHPVAYSEVDPFACSILDHHYPDMPEDQACRLSKDGPRYKTLGNAFAVPLVRWIGRRIELADEIFGRPGTDAAAVTARGRT